MMRTIPLAALLFCSFASVAPADAPLEGTKPAQWRVVWMDDPSTKATILWSTAKQGQYHSVQYHVKGDDQEPAEQLARTGQYTGGKTELFYHQVQLTDLEPATAYEIKLISDKNESAAFYFVTAPVLDREFSILHGGDSRSDRETRREVNAMIAKMFAESYENDDPADDILAFAHGGDYIVDGKKMDLWSAWLSDHELTTAPDGRLLPIIPARGNHDHGKPFNEVFGFPESDLNYYGINIGPEVRFVTLNSEISTAGDQANWLAQELERSRPNNRWLLVQYHRPVYPAVKGPGAGLKSWVPLFEEYNIDLACEADGHNIKRTVPIRGGKIDESGVVYIGEGGLGVPQRTPKTDRWFLESPGMADKGNHIFVLTFEKEKLDGKCVLLGGEVRDEFSRPIRATVAAP
ncbi:purple acid phosphatase family protein [Allorhodopirellula heiligendammensis]|uniref:PhoD-like phosphatase n=1 Tax=Allorhodopirellula heiligendammensis TaxID=2714739 RepID=A0A5C6C095_9BACT|nr:metallophosphoesterase family protein [Allorhodopirellula heiligendammensis]TWU16299.1 PhoD-like phosphatase [Allorhodopirellula heiligendammensis]